MDYGFEERATKFPLSAIYIDMHDYEASHATFSDNFTHATSSNAFKTPNFS